MPESVFIGVHLWFHEGMSTMHMRWLLVMAVCGLVAGCEIDATGPNGDASVNLTPTNGPDVSVSSRSDRSRVEFDTQGL